MAITAALKSPLDDALRSVRVEKFDGGLNSEADPGDLGLNESPDAQNVKVLKDGRLIGRDGYVVSIANTLAAPDGIAQFYDSSGARVLALFAGGNLYNVTSGTLTLIASGILVAGSRVAWTTLNNVIYYSEGTTPLRRWNPATGVEQSVPNAGGGANVAPPAAKVLTTYTGAIVAANCVTSGVAEPHMVRWCNINDPTTWVGTNAFGVGEGSGGEINSLKPFGVATVGISPFSALFVGKSLFGCYALRGALSGLSETLLSITAGVKDGATVQYVPGPDSAGYIVFLGTDLRVWATNGAQSGELSGKFRSELQQYVLDRLAASSSAIFTSGINTLDNCYILDLGGSRQYTYDWNNKAWMRYQGWPSGYWCEAPDGVGKPVVHCADRGSNRLVKCNVGLTDNGTAISPYWTTAWIHAGSPGMDKIWKFLVVEYMTDTSDLVITSTVRDGVGSADTVTLPVQVASVTSSSRWGISVWGTALWAASGLLVFSPYKKRIRLAHSNSTTGLRYPMRGENIKTKITQSTSGARFELLSMEFLYLPKGRKMVGVV